MISDIGSSNATALLCHTNRPPPSGGPNDSGGNWYKQDQTRVAAVAVSGPGFRRNRGPKVVRLKRTTSTGAHTPSEGIYRCEIKDSESTQTLYVGLYNRGGGNTIIRFFDEETGSPQFFVSLHTQGILKCLVI